MMAVETRERPRAEAFRFALRRATKTEHEALDAHPAFAALLDGRLTTVGYTQLMQLFHSFYDHHDAMLEQACQAFGFSGMGFDYAPRGGILSDDLVSLGVAPLRRQDGLATQMPLPRSQAELVGRLYVLDGSMLGGAVLLRAVGNLLGGESAAGGGYWRWCRDAGTARWAMTCALIETLARSETARGEMIDGAADAFSAFADWLALWNDAEPIRRFGSDARC